VAGVGGHPPRATGPSGAGGLGAAPAAWQAYSGFARHGFQRAITYRFMFWTELIVNLLFMYLYVCLWQALYRERTSVAGYGRAQLLSYIIVAQTVFTLQFTIRTVWVMEGKIRNGEVALDLMRPVDFQAMILATGLGAVAHVLVFNMAPKFAIFAVTGVVGPPASAAAVALFALAAALGYLVQFGVEYLLGLSAFWLVEVRGLYMLVMWAINAFFCGYFLPLEFYPSWLRILAEALPFSSIIYVPAAIYTGSLAGGAALLAVLKQLVWAIVLLAAGRLVFGIAHRRLVVQGG
jgi:ABC-2 type transport system permease protein